MTCSEIKVKIDLYDLLLEAERLQLDAHIATCPVCREYFAEAQRAQRLIQTAAALRPEPEHAARLTANIMTGIAQTQRRRYPISWSFVTILRQHVLRYTYALVCLLLVVGFAYEAARPIALPTTSHPHVATSNGATLNTAGFLKNLKDHDTLQVPALLACLKVSYTSDGNLACYDCEKLYAKFSPKP